MKDDNLIDAVSAHQRVAEFLAQNPPESLSDAEFLGRQFDAGLAWAHFDKGVGGYGGTFDDHRFVVAALMAAHAPDARDVNPLGWGVIAPAVHEYASRDLQERSLRRLFTGEDRYCQLFSEPGAGSDLAGLSTRAERDGDGWRITGQKVWTSLAHTSTRGALLARTDPLVPKHQGLTFFLIDLKQPGITVRPLRQITGEANFNEVYLDGAFVSDQDRVGLVGNGWRVATTALMNERRYNSDRSTRRNNENGMDELRRAVRFRIDANDIASEHVCAAARSWISLEALRLWQKRALVGGGNSADGAVGKVVWAEANQDAYAAAMDIIGQAGLLNNVKDDAITPNPDGLHSVIRGYLRSRAFSIEGGTSEIQRNVIGERILGLPVEPRQDKDIPWNQVPR